MKLNHTLNTENGWLSPQGKLYICESCEHEVWAMNYYIEELEMGIHAINFSDYLIDKGWIKLQTQGIGIKMFDHRWLPENSDPNSNQQK